METIRILAVSGISGSGKTVLVNNLNKYVSETTKNFTGLKQVTTREKRESEDEDAYLFIDEATYDKFIMENKLTAVTNVKGKRYGTLLDPDQLSIDNDLDNTIFTVVVDASGYKSLLKLVDREVTDYTYEVLFLRIIPLGEEPYVARKGRNHIDIINENKDLDNIENIYSLKNYKEINYISYMINKYFLKRITIKRDGKYYRFKTTVEIIKELGEVDFVWKKFIHSSTS